MHSFEGIAVKAWDAVKLTPPRARRYHCLGALASTGSGRRTHPCEALLGLLKGALSNFVCWGTGRIFKSSSVRPQWLWGLPGAAGACSTVGAGATLLDKVRRCGGPGDGFPGQTDVHILNGVRFGDRGGGAEGGG